MVIFQLWNSSCLTERVDQSTKSHDDDTIMDKDVALIFVVRILCHVLLH